MKPIDDIEIKAKTLSDIAYRLLISLMEDDGTLQNSLTIEPGDRISTLSEIARLSIRAISASSITIRLIYD